jgi:hypothetical protein
VSGGDLHGLLYLRPTISPAVCRSGATISRMSKQAEQEARDEILRVLGEMILCVVEHTPSVPRDEAERLNKDWAQAGVKIFAAVREPE